MPSIRLNKHFLVFAISATVFFLSASIVFSQVAGSPKKIGMPNIAMKTVELPISTPKAFVTDVVPAYDSGKEISNYTTAFQHKVLEAKDGKITLELSSVPIIVEEEEHKVVKNNPPSAYESSPFGIQGIEDQYEENFSYLPDLGVHWVRYAGGSGIVWDVVEPQKGRFDWSHNDSLFLKTYNSGINMIVTILTPYRWDQPVNNKWDQSIKEGRPTHKMPVNIEAYKQFLRKVIERYNGDGKDDAPGSPVVKYWQIENEVDNKIFWNDTMENYGSFLKCLMK